MRGEEERRKGGEREGGTQDNDPVKEQVHQHCGRGKKRQAERGAGGRGAWANGLEVRREKGVSSGLDMGRGNRGETGASGLEGEGSKDAAVD